MTVDTASRTRLAEENKMKILVNGMKDAIVTAVSSKNNQNDNSDILKLIVKREDDEKVYGILEKIGKAIAIMYKQMDKPFVLPKIFEVKGTVTSKIDKLPPVEITNLRDLEKYFRALGDQVSNLAKAVSLVNSQSSMPQVPLKSGPDMNKELIKVMNSLHDSLNAPLSVSGIDQSEIVDALWPIKLGIDSLVSRPTMTVAPVTNMNINALQGVVKTTSTTVGTTLTQLPAYGQLLMRRSLILFNNGANTIYFGGSDVTAANGTPVLSQSYSPSIDAGYGMVVYGIASTGSNDVRVMEVSSTTQQVGSSTT